MNDYFDNSDAKDYNEIFGVFGRVRRQALSFMTANRVVPDTAWFYGVLLDRWFGLYWIGDEQHYAEKMSW